jgi:hypothetical protein
MQSQAPGCGNCRSPMGFVVEIPEVGTGKIVRFFQCSSCSRTKCIECERPPGVTASDERISAL